MKFLSSEKLSQHKYKTPEGYLICTDAILARTGKQTYRKCEVFADAADDESEIEIDRKAEEVFAPETLASFENKPITVEHPDENVTPDNYNDLSVGFVRDVHKGTVDGQDVMLGTLVITDAKAIEEIENGEHTDLSCGYDCDITDEANPQQRNIRGNHVALCEQGRAGIARIVDSIKDSNDSIDRNKIEQIVKSRQFELRKNGDKIQEYIYKGNAEDKKYNFEELAKALPTNVSLALFGDELSVAFRDSVKDENNVELKDHSCLVYTDDLGYVEMTGPTTKEKLEEYAYQLADVFLSYEDEDGRIRIVRRPASTLLKKLKSGKMRIIKVLDSVKDSILGKHVIIRLRDVRMNKYVDERGIVHSYEGTNADDIVEVKLNNGQYVEVRYDEIRFLDASYKDEQKPYGITPRRKWQSSKKIERYATTLEEAKFDKNASERADGIDYVVVDTRTMRVVDGKKTFTIRTEDEDNIYIAKVRANNAIEAFNKFNNKK